MKKLHLVLMTALLVGVGLAQPAAAQSTPPPPAQAPPATAPTASASIVGKWNGSVDAGNGPMAFVLDLKLDGKKVTGSLTGDQGVLPLEGEFVDNKLTFSISFDTPNGAFAVSFTATLKDDVLTGTADAGQMGQLPFKADRAKDKASR